MQCQLHGSLCVLRLRAKCYLLLHRVALTAAVFQQLTGTCYALNSSVYCIHEAVIHKYCITSPEGDAFQWVHVFSMSIFSRNELCSSVCSLSSERSCWMELSSQDSEWVFVFELRQQLHTRFHWNKRKSILQSAPSLLQHLQSKQISE